MQKMRFSNILSILFYIIAVLMPSQAAIFNTPCVDELTGDSNGCTANDIAVQDIQIVWVGDGCTGPTDTALVRMDVTLATANPDRYDPGIYINTFGGTSAVTATGSQCLHEALYPLNNATFDYASGVGPFKDLDGDATGDMLGNETLKRSITQGDIGDANQSTLAEFQISCADNDDGLGNGPNGYVDFAWAVSYAQQANAINGINILDTVPGAKSKCTSGVSDTEGTVGSIKIGVPDMNTSITCTVDTTRTNVLNCTVSYVNNSLVGPADYLGFYIDYNASQSTISNISTPLNSATPNTDTNTDNGSGRITWKVDDGMAIGPGDTGSFTFDVTLTDFTADLNISIIGVYDNGIDPALTQPSLYDEYIMSQGDFGTLPVTIAYVDPEKNGASLDVKFSTATEVGNVGFNFYAIDGHKWIKLNDELIPGALDSFEPQDYQVSLDIPKGLEFNKIGVAGVDVNGKEDRHGAFKIGHKSGSKAEVVKVDWGKVNKQVRADKKARRAAKKAARKATNVALNDQVINLSVSENAVYRVTHDDLLEKGINLTGQKAKNIAISFRGKGVPRYIDGLSKTGKWTKDSFIEFMGTTLDGSDALYLDANNYRLSLSKKLAIESEAIKPLTISKMIFESNIRYGNTIPSDDPFYDGFFYANGSRDGTLIRKFDLPRLGEGKSEIIVYLSAGSETTHHLLIAFNGIEVANVRAEGRQAWPIQISVDNTVLQEGKNEITLTALGENEGYDIYAYDKLVFSYDHKEPIPSSLPIISVENKKTIGIKKGTNYVIISHPLFFGETLNHYITQRENEGWKIQLVDVEDIYASYGYGMATPDAIKAFLKTAKKKGVTHVQLVGASSYDYHDYLGSGSVSFIPSIYVTTNDIIKYTPSDTSFVTNNEGKPQLAIGRWPVRTVEDLEAVVNKSLIWKSSGQPASHTALFIADKKDESLSFAKQMEFIAQKFEKTAKWNNISRVYLDEFIETNNGDIKAAVNSAREAIKESLSQGPSITSFSGHASPSAWSYDNLLKQNDIVSIENTEKPTLVLPLACYTTYADGLSVDTLAHQLLASGENGAVAIYGATFFSAYAENGMIASNVIDHLFNGATIGEAVLKSKNSLLQGYDDAILNGNLLGDVTLRLQ